MNHDSRRALIGAGLAVAIGLPLIFYALGDVPRRNLLKEGLSLLTILSFVFLLGQMFLTRINTPAVSAFKMPLVQRLHKAIGYGAMGVMLLHPVLVVLPRFFEGGVRPGAAFWTMVTNVSNLGIDLGLAAWAALLALGLVAWFRLRLMARLANRYRGWRGIHGAMAMVFVALATGHAILLGRHSEPAMVALYLALAVTGPYLVARLYLAPTTARANPTAAKPAHS
ncbi:MAG: hypothetical protein D6801_07465, partial [Alphaproteobacteria bacterium]